MQTKSSQNATLYVVFLSATCFDQTWSSSGWPLGRQEKISVQVQLCMYFSFLPCWQPDSECVWSKHVADMSTKSIVFWVDLVCILEDVKLTMAYCSVSDFITLALFLILYVDEKEFQYCGIHFWDVGICVLNVNAKCENTLFVQT